MYAIECLLSFEPLKYKQTNWQWLQNMAMCHKKNMPHARHFDRSQKLNKEAQSCLRPLRTNEADLKSMEGEGACCSSEIIPPSPV